MFALCLLLPAADLSADAKDDARLNQGIEATVEPITIPFVGSVDIEVDGQLKEAAWSTLEPFDNMTVVEPDRLERPRYATRARFLGTPQGLFVGIHSEQPNDTLVAQLSGRDSNLNRDGVELTLDSSGQGLYGYYFNLGLGGSLGDGTVLPERNLSPEWDGPWSGATQVVEDGWTAEFFIPWSVLNMPNASGDRRMGFYLSRRVAHLSERWGWPALSFTKPRFLSAFQPITLQEVQPSQEYSLYPYVSFTGDGVNDQTEFKAGIDAFWRPSANMQFNLALNPDFGQVEADDVVVNVSAFETFFPEKRLFFLEGQEIFATTGSGGPPPGSGGGGFNFSGNNSGFARAIVHTRRIGSSIRARAGAPDIPAGATTNPLEASLPVELLGAAKITGQSGGLRYGVLTAFEDDTEFALTRGGITSIEEAPGRDFLVGRLLYEVAESGNRSSYGAIATLTDHPDRQAMVYGADARYLLNQGQISIDAQLLASDVESVKGYGAFGSFRYQPKRGVTHRLSLDYFDEKFSMSDFGFLRRNDTLAIIYSFFMNESRDIGSLRERDTFAFLRHEQNSDGLATRSALFLRRGWTFGNSWRLFGTFDYFPDQWDDRTSLGFGSYRVEQKLVTSWNLQTDSSKALTFSTGFEALQEDLGGQTFNVRSEVGYRFSDRLSTRFSVGYGHREGWLVHRGERRMAEFDAQEWRPRWTVDAFISARQQLRLDLQWVGVRAFATDYYEVPLRRGALVDRAEPATSEDFAINDLVLQLRYRWELAPLSDLFVVYNRGGFSIGPDPDNSFDSLFSDIISEPTAEQLIVKLRYRFGS